MFLPLSSWIQRTHPLPERFYKKNYIDHPNREWSVWVELEEVCDLYQANNMNWISLKDSRQKTQNYLSQVSKIIGGIHNGWIDREEREMILEALGMPPKPCLPIYIISIGNRTKESVAYIGKTKSNSRFSGGHLAALKLHHPQYSLIHKRIYRCSVWFYFNNEYIALE